MKTKSAPSALLLGLICLALLPSVAVQTAASGPQPLAPAMEGRSGERGRFVMPYEGYITAADGSTLPDGDYDFVFTLYTSPEGGDAIWFEEHKQVRVRDGIVRLELGSRTTPLELPFDRPYYLSIRVGSGPALEPRVELPTAAYSFRSRLADEVPNASITTEKLAPGAVTDEQVTSVGWDKITGIPKQLLVRPDLKDGDSEAPDRDVLSTSESVPANVWSLQGNRNTKPELDYLGTADGQPLVIKTDGTERVTIRETGQVDVASDLNVAGNANVVNDVDVGNDATIGNDLGVDRNANIANDLTVGHDATVDNDLSVSGKSSFEGEAEFNGGAQFSDLSVDGSLGIGTSPPTSSLLHVKGAGTFGGNHIALFENDGNNDPDRGLDGLAIKLNVPPAFGGALGHINNYVTFMDGAETVLGRIEAESVGEYLLKPTTLIKLGELAYLSVSAGIAIAAIVVDPSPAFSQIAKVTAKTIEFNAYLLTSFENDVSITYASGSGDYAEWLERLHPDESMSFGDIVGVFGGRVTKQLDGAEQILSVSMSPIVLGNMPEKGREQFFEKIAFLGQVPIRVVGPVEVGDYIVPSGRNDGTGTAVSPEMMTAKEFVKVVGRAWQSSPAFSEKLVRVVVGLGTRDVASLVQRHEDALVSLRADVAARDAALATLRADVADLRSAVESMQRSQARWTSQAVSNHSSGDAVTAARAANELR